MKQLAWKQRLVDVYRSFGMHTPRMLPGPVILMYHGVIESDADVELDRWNITLREFTRHIRFIAKAFDVISLDSLVDAVIQREDLPKNGIVIIFDDAFVSVFERARSVLLEHGLPYTVAASAGLIGSTRTIWSQEVRLIILKSQCRSIDILTRDGIRSWQLDSSSSRLIAARSIERHLGDKDPAFREKALEYLYNQLPAGEYRRLLERHHELRIMSCSQLRQLSDEGVTIAAHGWFHTPLMDGVDESVLQREIVDAKRQLEILLEARVDHFVFPHGQCSSASTEILKKSEYRSGLTTRAGCVTPGSDVYRLPRIAAECTLLHLRRQLFQLRA